MKHDTLFLQTTFSLVTSGSSVLDLGAGSGAFSELFVEHGAQVTAVDVALPEELPQGITRQHMRVEEYMANHAKGEQFDMVFMRNILQFLDKEWVFATLFQGLTQMVRPGGIIAIETFYGQADPPFQRPHRSLYNLQELTEHFVLWDILHANEEERDGLDMSGVARHFYMTEFIARRTE